MAQGQDNLGKHASALEALAAGRDAEPPQVPAGDGPEAVAGPAAPEEMALSGLAVERPEAGDALSSLAGDDGPAGAASNGGAGAAAEALGGFAAPAAGRAGRYARLHAATHRAHAHQYKRTMVPVLIIVGAMLLVCAIFTILVLAGDSSDPSSMAAEGTYFREYGHLFVVVALPMGAILLLGAWLFHVEARKSGK